jgi:hypothetical protein
MHAWMSVFVIIGRAHGCLEALLLCLWLHVHVIAFNVVEARIYSCLGLRLGWPAIEQSSIF